MKNFFPKIIRRNISLYSGKGYEQGMGVDLTAKTIEFWWFGKEIFRFITDIYFDVNSMWLEDLDERLKNV